MYHIPVLLDESVSALLEGGAGVACGADVGAAACGVYADATFGGGGHSREILRRLGPSGRLMSFDKDADAIANYYSGKTLDAAGNHVEPDSRLLLVRNNFRFIHNFTMLHFPDGLDGILADLGVSSHQFDTAERGFSFRFEAPLDMRMNDKAALSAADVVNTYDESALSRIFRLYGELDDAHKVSYLINKARKAGAISTTTELCKALEPLLPSQAEHKYLAKVFQALRIEVNHEMEDLEKFLIGASRSLKPGGRLSVITYHSLEDRMVKNFIKAGNIDGEAQKDFFGNRTAPLRAVNKKPILPREEEIAANTRARSAKLRVAEKI